jgi:hypothetical protein
MRRCAGCHGWFSSILGLDAHRRNPHARLACRYTAGERRTSYRPGWLARSELRPFWGS